jgi:hypothetical protein
VDLDVYVSIFLSTKGVDVGKKELQRPEANRAALAGSGFLRLPVLCVPIAEVLGAYKLRFFPKYFHAIESSCPSNPPATVRRALNFFGYAMNIFSYAINMPPRRDNMGQLPGAVVKHVPIRQVEKRASEVHTLESLALWYMSNDQLSLKTLCCDVLCCSMEFYVCFTSSMLEPPRKSVKFLSFSDRSFEMEDEPELYSTKDKSRKVRSKVRYLKQGHQKSQSISPLDKQVEPEEPLANYRNTSIQALYTLFSKCYAYKNVNDRRSITEREKNHLRNLAEDVERAILAQHGDFTDPYHPTREYGNQIRTLRYNVANNQSLQTRIIMGELSPTAVARLTPEEMLTKTARDEQHEKEARAYDLLRLDRNLAPQVTRNEEKPIAYFG